MAAAEGKLEPVSVHMEAYKIVVEKDVEHQRPAKKANPDDVLEYIASYKNNTDHAVNNLMATLPIPEGTIFLPATSNPKGAQASLDGEKYADIPLTRRVQLPSGKWEVQNVPYKEYRSLRWNLQTLAAGKDKAVSARVRVAPLEETSMAKEER
jgi:uncharacterized repeat protein (TIGR01451 family)